MNSLSSTTSSSNPLNRDESNSIKRDIDLVLAAQSSTRSNNGIPNTPDTSQRKLTYAEAAFTKEAKSLREQIKTHPERKAQIESIIAAGEAKLQRLREDYKEITSLSTELVSQSIKDQTQISQDTFNAIGTGTMSLADAGGLLQSFQA